MDATRSAKTTADDFRVLLVGPERWQERARPAFTESEGLSVRSSESAASAVEAATTGPAYVDVVVSAYRLAETTGLGLLSELRSSGVESPFVLLPIDGSERLASDAIEAGVADYLPMDADPAALRRRCRRAVRRRDEERRRSTKADQFEAFFSTPDQFTAVLDNEGSVVRMNDRALRSLEVEPDRVRGKRFWALPWTDAGDSRRELQRAVQRARDGEYVEFEAGHSASIDGTRFEFSVRPITADGRAPEYLVVAGREVDERARLEEELRKSEELHRVTLNNMTDTVLVTDDGDEFTYVCPNVHFIFGYSAEEIHDLGTIDALLGDDLFDRDRLEAEGVLTNIECTATDKDGREHTLLVNARRVSIQGGTTLYSCRDVTKRKQRERALTQLHRTSRDLLYAETKPEIAEQVVSDAASLLSAGAAIYQFDREENVLYPTAVSDEIDSIIGTLPELRLDREALISRAFVEDETLSAGTASRCDRRRTALSTLGDYTTVPLGDHGVFVVAPTDDGTFDGGTLDDETFDDVSEEIAELLAATTEAALDRVGRENELRERDRTLQRQNRRLSQLNRVNEFIREIDQALVEAETRERIETAVCELLTADDRFAFAWIGETTPLSRTLHPQSWAGDGQGYLDSIPLEFDSNVETAEPSVRAADEREPALVSNVADHLRTGRWCKEALSREFQSVLSIPLAYDGVLFGTLSVYANRPDAFDDMTRSVLRELGDTVAAAINAVQRKEALQSDSVVELEYRISDPNTTLHRLASETNATIQLEGDVARDDDTTLVFVTIEDAGLDTVVETADEFVSIEDAELIRENDAGGLTGLRIRGDFVTTVLADHGAVLRQLWATPEGLSLTVDVPDSVTTRSIDEVISNTYDEAEPVSQRNRTRALDAEDQQGRFLDELTERQMEVAQIAYHVGFFDSQRDMTGRDVASMLDISHTAFYDHVRRIQRKLFASLFESRPRPTRVE